MLTEQILIKKLKDNAVIPTYGSTAAAGADLYACMEDGGFVEIVPGDTVMIHTGIAMAIPEGFAGLVYARSGLALKKGLAPANKVGVIDADYRGEIMVPMHNHSKDTAVIEHGERIAQMIFTPYLRALFEETERLGDTQRGISGFGSTGLK